MLTNIKFIRSLRKYPFKSSWDQFFKVTNRIIESRLIDVNSMWNIFGCLSTRRPVRLVLDRDEDMLVTGTRHPFLCRWKVSFTGTGLLQALEMELWSNMGCFLDVSSEVMDRAMFTIDSAYQWVMYSIDSSYLWVMYSIDSAYQWVMYSVDSAYYKWFMYSIDSPYQWVVYSIDSAYQWVMYSIDNNAYQWAMYSIDSPYQWVMYSIDNNAYQWVHCQR